MFYAFSKDKTAMILFHLDMKGIAVSRGVLAKAEASGHRMY
jgi:hypothetical protein